MQQIKMAGGEVVYGSEQSDHIISVAPTPGGFWCGIGAPNNQGILVDHVQWRGLVDLINAADAQLKEDYNA